MDIYFIKINFSERKEQTYYYTRSALHHFKEAAP